MIIKTPRHFRGDIIIALNNERIAWITAGILILLTLVFTSGFALGRWFFPLPKVETKIVEVPAVNEAAGLPEIRTDTLEVSGRRVRDGEKLKEKERIEAIKDKEKVSGKKYAIVAASIPVGDTPALAREEAERRLAALKAKGFTNARIEVSITGKGKYLRIIAMEAIYPSALVARNDIEAMKRRGELVTAFPILLEDNR